VRTQKRKQPAFRENAEVNRRLNPRAIRQEGATLGIVKGIECRGSRRMESLLAGSWEHGQAVPAKFNFWVFHEHPAKGIAESVSLIVDLIGCSGEVRLRARHNTDFWRRF